MHLLLGTIGVTLFVCGVLLSSYPGTRRERAGHERIAVQRRHHWRPPPQSSWDWATRLTVADEDTRLEHRIAQLRTEARVAESFGGRRP